MILRALARLIGEVALWTGLVALVATAVALGVRRATGERGLQFAGVAAAVVGALVLAGASDRLDLPQPLVVDIGRRPLPVAWVLAGAIAGAALLWLRRRTPASTVSGDSVSSRGEDDGIPE